MDGSLDQVELILKQDIKNNPSQVWLKLNKWFQRKKTHLFVKKNNTWCLAVSSPLDLDHTIVGGGEPVTEHLRVPVVPWAIVVLSGVTLAVGTSSVKLILFWISQNMSSPTQT